MLMPSVCGSIVFDCSWFDGVFRNPNVNWLISVGENVIVSLIANCCVFWSKFSPM